MQPKQVCLCSPFYSSTFLIIINEISINKQEEEIPRVNSKDTLDEGENIGPITPAANQAAATVVQKSDNDLFCPILIG